MIALKLQKNTYGLKVYCTKCKRQHNEHTIKNCSHPLYQKYRLIFYVDGKPITKTLETREFEDALIEAIQIKKDVRLGAITQTLKEDKDDPNSITLINAANLYIDYRHGNDVLPQHEHKNKIGPEAKKALIFYINQFIQVLRDNNFNVDKLPFSQIGDKHIGYWYKHITNHYGEGTWTTPISYIRPWFKHMRVMHKVKMIDPLEGVSFKKKVNTIVTINKEQFEAVIEAIDTKDKYVYLGCKTKSKKNMHRDWLETAFKLGLYTGLRNAELISLTWENLHYNEKTKTYMIISDNFKVEKMTGQKYKPKYVPCGPELLQVLKDIGLKNLIDTDFHLIAPRRENGSKSMIGLMSKAWTHYFKQALPEDSPLPFKTLRKTYLSALNKAMGKDMIEFSSHSGMEVLEKHYLDPKKVAKGLDVKVFE